MFWMGEFRRKNHVSKQKTKRDARQKWGKGEIQRKGLTTDLLRGGLTLGPGRQASGTDSGNKSAYKPPKKIGQNRGKLSGKGGSI